MTVEAHQPVFQGELPWLVKQATMDNYFRPFTLDEQMEIRERALRLSETDRSWHTTDEARAYKRRVAEEHRSL